jgi:hypothetical protein
LSGRVNAETNIRLIAGKAVNGTTQRKLHSHRSTLQAGGGDILIVWQPDRVRDAIYDFTPRSATELGLCE